jgi:hypothetical protein
VGDGVDIGGDVFLGDGFSAEGMVSLVEAKIGGQLVCSDNAKLTNEGGAALSADRAEIGSMAPDWGFCITGAVSLVGAKIGGALQCARGKLSTEGIALDASEAAIGGTLTFRQVDTSGGVVLSRASATTLNDDLGQTDNPLGSWRTVRFLVLDSFAYARFGPWMESDSRIRRRWLEHTADFEQSAWQQLIHGIGDLREDHVCAPPPPVASSSTR